MGNNEKSFKNEKKSCFDMHLQLNICLVEMFYLLDWKPFSAQPLDIFNVFWAQKSQLHIIYETQLGCHQLNVLISTQSIKSFYPFIWKRERSSKGILCTYKLMTPLLVTRPGRLSLVDGRREPSCHDRNKSDLFGYTMQDQFCAKVRPSIVTCHKSQVSNRIV